MLIRLFVEFLEGNKDAFNHFMDMDIPEASQAMIESCLDKVPLEVDREYVRKFISNGQELLSAAKLRFFI
jgi:hypothetical protein